MIDKSIYEDGNGGQLEFKGANINTTETFYTLIYIKLFGGNIKQSTTKESNNNELHNDWWGNEVNENPINWINSRTEKTLYKSSTDSLSLINIKQAVVYDLNELEVYGDVNVNIIFPDVNRVQIDIEITQKENTSDIQFTWDSVKNEIIERRWL